MPFCTRKAECWSMKSASACVSPIGGGRRKKSRNPNGSSSKASGRRRRAQAVLAFSTTKGGDLLRKSYKGRARESGSVFPRFATRPSRPGQEQWQGGCRHGRYSALLEHHIGAP